MDLRPVGNRLSDRHRLELLVTSARYRVARHHDRRYRGDHCCRNQKKRTRPGTPVSRAITSIWQAVGTAIFIYCFAVGASGHAEIHTYMGTVEILLGVANCAISLVLRWRGQFLIALLWWISAVATCFVSMRLVMPILVFDTLVGFLGFGLYLMYRERRDRRLRVQHA